MKETREAQVSLVRAGGAGDQPFVFEYPQGLWSRWKNKTTIVMNG